ncbi:MAG: carbohydrate-binding domain-containing protein [Synergistaceae bacterium]|nr:carbohydrate-binding domain-containing protein [Synergistaceae bacterium]
MKKIPGALFIIVMAWAIFSLSGCSGGGGSGDPNSSKSNSATTSEIKDVVVITSPALDMHSDYKIISGATFLSGMGNSQYYVAGDIGSEASQATLNLGFTEDFDKNSSFVIMNASTGRVVFAYNPQGENDTWKTSGTVSISGGVLLRYDGLTFDDKQESETASAALASIEFDDSEVISINLNGTSATLTSSGSTTNITRYPYVWHADPNNRYEYFTRGISGETIGSPSQGIGYEYDSNFVNNDNSVYIARDIRYMTSDASFTGTATKDGETEYAAYYADDITSEVASEKGSAFSGPYIFATLPASQNSNLTTLKSAMTHSATEAYNNPVLHITEAGIYSLSGTWNGQISVEADALLILNGVTVTCTVAPAIVFTEDASELSTYTTEALVATSSMDVGQALLDTLTSNLANIVLIADGSTNTVTGSNVYRIMKAEPKSSATKVNGSDISDQKKLYKMDGAFYSYRSLAICGEDNATGILNIKSTTLEGLDSELHMTIESGVINIETPDDAINVNEDDISVFTMLGGNLTIKSTNGDGIDSNGYVVIKGGTLNITAGNQADFSAGEAGIDSEKGTYIASGVNYTWNSVSGGGNTPAPGPNPSNPSSGDNRPEPPNPTSGDTPPEPPSPASNDNRPQTSEPNTPSTPASSDITSRDVASRDVSNNDEPDMSNEFYYWYYINQQNLNNSQNQEQTSKEDDYKYNDADVLKSAKQTDKGITAINIGTGKSLSFIQKDTDTKQRTIPTSDNVFRLDRKINTFSGIKY